MKQRNTFYNEGSTANYFDISLIIILATNMSRILVTEI